MKKKYYLIFVYISALIGIIFLLGGFKSENDQQKTFEHFVTSREPAIFKFGQTTMVESFKVDSSGGLFEIGNKGTPIDGTMINVPIGALNKETIISIGYNDGILTNLHSGKCSDVAIVLKTDGTMSFKKFVTVTVRYDASTSPRIVAGYVVDEQGRLHGLQGSPINKVNNTVSFHSQKPITFIYIID